MTPVRDNPQITFVYGQPFGPPPPCLACGKPVDPVVGYFALWVGSADDGKVVAVAHGSLWEGPGEDDWCPWCEDLLRSRWLDKLDRAGAGVLEARPDGGGLRWFLRGEELHASCALDLLTAEGVWLPGRFEYQARPEPVASFHLTLAGWDGGDAVVCLPPDAVVRIPLDRR